jgi:atypical dual specificity phosphatase
MSFESSLVWVQPSLLCFGEKPGRWRAIEEDLDLLYRCGVRGIISLIEQETQIALYLKKGFIATNIPVVDFHAPSQAQIDECMKVISDLHALSKPVYLHCFAGVGRSGTMAAAWLIHGGKEPLDAIRTIRGLKLGTIESDEQLNALFEFAARREFPQDSQSTSS